jgi:hypothetical protein
MGAVGLRPSTIGPLHRRRSESRGSWGERSSSNVENNGVFHVDEQKSAQEAEGRSLEPRNFHLPAGAFIQQFQKQVSRVSQYSNNSMASYPPKGGVLGTAGVSVVAHESTHRRTADLITNSHRG